MAAIHVATLLFSNDSQAGTIDLRGIRTFTPAEMFEMRKSFENRYMTDELV